MVPTMEFRCNKRPELVETSFLGKRGIYPIWSNGRRPVGFRLEQKWVSDASMPYWKPEEFEWRPIPFAEECLDANPELDVNDRMFWPVADEPPR